jgi:hypothetical protein
MLRSAVEGFVVDAEPMDGVAEGRRADDACCVEAGMVADSRSGREARGDTTTVMLGMRVFTSRDLKVRCSAVIFLSVVEFVALR